MPEQQELFDFDDLYEPRRRVNIKRGLSKRIATVSDADRASKFFLEWARGNITEQEFNESLEDCVIENGMTKEEIERYFPPTPQHKDKLSFNRTALIASIIWEERELVGKKRPPGNVRHFWYTNLMYTLMKVMKDTNVDNIQNTYQKVLSDLVKYEGFRYSDLNLTSDKSELCESLFSDSPYPNVIIACEKESYHDHLKRLANIFRITFISLGGQGSYKVYEDLVVDFINAGIDINQDFHIFTISDFDPQGYCIQDTAKEHLERAGIRKVIIHRVYLCAEHITKGIVDRHAVPYVWEKNTQKGNKAALTLYNKFGERTGGIYKNDEAWQRFSKNGSESYDVPQFVEATNGYDLFRVELDNFRDEVLLELLIDALAEFMDGSEYYYKQAQDYIDELFQQRIETVIHNMVTREVRTSLRNEYLLSSEIEQQISNKSAEIVAADREIFDKIAEDYSNKRADIEQEISRLRSEMYDMDALYESIDSFRIEWEATKTRHLINLYHEYESVIPNELKSYLRNTKECLFEEILQKMKEEDFSVRNKVDFSEFKNKIFNEARAGADKFEEELSYSHRVALNNLLDDELREREDQIRPTIQLPEPQGNIKEITERAGKIKKKLENITEGEVDESLRHQMKTLCYLFEDADRWTLSEFWGYGTSLDDALEYVDCPEDDDEY